MQSTGAGIPAAERFSTQNLSSLKTYFDEIEETKGDDECRAWLSRVLDAKLELATFVATRRGRGRATEYVGFLKGSFTFSLRFKFSDGGLDAIIRFPKPGHTATTLCDENVTNEVQAMDYLTEHTTIPIPRVYSWGLTADGDGIDHLGEEARGELGPFVDEKMGQLREYSNECAALFSSTSE